MTPQEIEFNNTQSKLRREAVDKEMQRLRSINRNQEHKIWVLRKVLYSQLFFFVMLIVVFLLRGMITFSGSSSKDEFEAFKLEFDDLKNVNSSIDDSLNRYKTRLEAVLDNNLFDRDENGLKFRVQIGAFKELNLKEYTSNLVAINQEVYDSINQYTLGVFSNYKKAAIFLENIRKMGFEDSFIISTKDGRRIPIENLSQEELYPEGKELIVDN